MKFRNNRGFTILELLITIAVLVILATVAVPNLRSAIQNNRMTAQSNAFLTAFQLARSEALKRKTSVSVCPSSDGASCGTDWEDGWIVYIDGDSAGSGSTSVGEVLQIWGGLKGGASNNGDEPSFVRYIAEGSVDRDAGTSYPITFELEIPDCVGDNNRQIEITPMGRAGVTRHSCG